VGDIRRSSSQFPRSLHSRSPPRSGGGFLPPPRETGVRRGPSVYDSLPSRSPERPDFSYPPEPYELQTRDFSDSYPSENYHREGYTTERRDWVQVSREGRYTAINPKVKGFGGRSHFRREIDDSEIR